MPKDERPEINLEDGDGNRLNAIWSRSSKHLIVTVLHRGRWHESSQIELDPDQLEHLSAFIEETRPN